MNGKDGNELDMMLKNLSIFAKVEPRKTRNDADDEDDEDDDDLDDEEDFDDEPDEEEQEQEHLQQQQQQQQQPPPPSNHAQNDKNIFKIPEIVKLDNDNMKVKSAAADTDDQFSNFNGDFLSLRNPCQIKPITIRTDYTCSVDYQKSPRSQLFEVANQLDKERREKRKLDEELNKYKTLHKTQEIQVKSLTELNDKLAAELKGCKRLVEDLKNRERHQQLNESHQSELEYAKHENSSLIDRITSLDKQNSELRAQIEKLKKYENMFKEFQGIHVNNKLYQVVKQIGHGGFSEVYQCIPFRESVNYAVKKVNLSSLDAESMSLVMNEIELLKKLQVTDKVIKLIDFELNKQKNLLLVVMEMGSMDLNGFFKSEIHKHKCVPEPSRVYYWKMMLEAVEAIHKLGVIHSDLKPSNFLLVGCEVKLIDFNISNSMNMERTSITLKNDCGTLNYMAPEAILRDDIKVKINQKADVWSLGVILYLMSYGRLPFQHIKNQYKLIHALADPLKKEITFGQLDNEDLFDVIKKCLSHEPSNRYSVKELLSHSYIKNKSN